MASPQTKISAPSFHRISPTKCREALAEETLVSVRNLADEIRRTRYGLDQEKPR